MSPARSPLTWLERMLAKSTPNENGCWIWQEQSRNKQGYALAHGPDRKMALAHRLAYKAMVGPIPEGLELDHLCFNPPCINPAHLEPVTRAENIRRRTERQTHCKHGHEFTAENTRRTPQGHRQCITCKRAYELAAYYAGRRKRYPARTTSPNTGQVAA